MKAIETFGQRLKAERMRCGYTGAELAGAGGVGKTAQYLYEVDRNRPNVDYLLKVEAMGLDLDYMLHGDGELPSVPMVLIRSDLLSEVFRMIEFYCQDDNGRPSEPAIKAELFRSICNNLEEDPTLSDDKNRWRAKVLELFSSLEIGDGQKDRG